MPVSHGVVAHREDVHRGVYPAHQLRLDFEKRLVIGHLAVQAEIKRAACKVPVIYGRSSHCEAL